MTRAEMVAACKAINPHLNDCHTWTDDVVRDCYQAWCRTDAKDEPEMLPEHQALIDTIDKQLSKTDKKHMQGVLSKMNKKEEQAFYNYVYVVHQAGVAHGAKK